MLPHSNWNRNPTTEATMNDHGIHLMPPWTFAVGAITGATTALIGWITPEVTVQWMGVLINAAVGVIWVYGYWVRTTTASKIQATAALRKSDAHDDEISSLYKTVQELSKEIGEMKRR